MTHCPLIGEGGEILPPTGDKFGAVWDSGLPSACVRACFNEGLAAAEANGSVETSTFVSQEELDMAEGDTGYGEGIRATGIAKRISYIEIDDGLDVDNDLSSSTFSFDCLLYPKVN